MLSLSNLKPFSGSRKNKKRVGRGPGSGHGKTACRGQKGQKSRSGVSIPAGFQGGQMSLYRQLPKRGFKNPFKIEYGVLNVGVIARLNVDKIDLEIAQKMGVVKKRHRFFKVLGEGEINRPVKVIAHAVSESARKKIEAAGGQIEIIS